MSYRRRPAYGGVRRARPYGRRPVRRAYGRSQYRRAIVPRARMLSRFPAGLSGGRGATEMKSVDSTAQPTLSYFSTGGTSAVVLSPPQNGSAFYNRIGTRTRAVSLELRGHIRPNPTSNNAAAVLQQFARVMIIYDRQTNGSAASLADILTDYDQAGSATTGSVFNGLNMNNRDRFLVLRDRKIVLGALGVNCATPAASTGLVVDPMNPGSYLYTEFIKLKGLETHYKSSSNPGAIGDIATGSFMMVTISSLDNNANPAWVLQYNARFKFFD